MKLPKMLIFYFLNLPFGGRFGGGFINLSKVSLGSILVLIFSACGNQENTINLNANDELNTHATEVGTWVNSTMDKYEPGFIEVLKELNTKSIRHGWQYTVMDKQDHNVFNLAPCDPDVQSYIGDGNGHVKETLVVDEIAQITKELDISGFGILSTDGINYTGQADKRFAGMSREQREQYFIDNAVRWAEWAKDNNFRYFEIGNENDLPGEMCNKKLGTKWTPEAYGAFAQRIAMAIKKVNPEIKCGINGGFGETPELREQWWHGIATGAPEINKSIDFIVIHKYAFEVGYETWKNNLWDFGKIHPDNLEGIRKYFPGKPVCVTEISGFKMEEGIVAHYRGVLNCEMMGNVFSDKLVEVVHHWPTRWEDFGALDAESNSLNALGKGLAAYTRFAKPVMTSNGVFGKVRYFMAKDPADNSLTLWLVNRDSVSTTINVAIDNFNCSKAHEHWKLVSPDNDPMSTQNNLVRQPTIEVNIKKHKAKFAVEVNPTSVSIITFK
jgi:hypothetical protein